MPVLNWRELQNIVDRKQKGFDASSNDVNYDAVTPEQWEQFDAELQDFLNANKREQFDITKSGRDEYRQYISDLTQNGNESDNDYGSYRNDFDIPYEEWITDPVNIRANSQRGINQILNGLGKMSVYAPTTAADNIVGLLAGLVNVGVETGIDIANGNNVSLASIGDSFINNPFSNAMQAVRDWSERVMPNYRTTEEIDDADQWWKHLNANFWGDAVLKNIGFTIGAGFSGNMLGRLGRLTRGKLMNDAYKAAVAASVDGDAAAEAAFRKVLASAGPKKAAVASNAFGVLRPSFKKMNVSSQIVGGFGGAVGEARMEGMLAAREFRDEYLSDAQSRYEEAKNALSDDISSNPDYHGYEDVYDGFGNVIGRRPSLNTEGRLAWETGLKDIQSKYNSELDLIDKEANRVANGTFLLNLPLLSMSNIVMFGRMLGGGYRSQLKSRVKVLGEPGRYRGSGSAINSIGRGLANTATEGIEELSQKIISEGEKDLSAYNMAAFHNGKYDIDSIRGLASWMGSMLDSSVNVLDDPASWQEFAIGALTGAIGMPTHLGFSNWSGGLIGGIQEGNQYSRMSQAFANKLNERVNDPSFKNLWEGAVRHNTFEAVKEDALENQDAFKWHNADDAGILSDVILFSNAGRLNDLEDIVDSFSDLRIEDIPEIRKDFIDESDPDFMKKSDGQMLDWIHERASKVKDTINKYRDYSDSIDPASLGTTDDELLNEFLYSRVQMRNAEDRYNSLLPDVVNDVRRNIENSGTISEKENNLLSDISILENLFGKNSNKKHYDWNDAIEVKDNIAKKAIGALDAMCFYTDKADTLKNINDLKRLINNRQDLYSRIFDDSSREKFVKGYTKNAKTDSGTAVEIKNNEKVERANDALSSIDESTSIKDAYYNKPANERAKFVEDLIPVKDLRADVKSFLDLYDSYNSFRKQLNDNAPGLRNKNTGGFSNVAEILLDDAFQKSDNEKELIDNLINSLPDVKQVSDIIQSRVADGTLTEEEAMPLLVNNQYDAAVKAIKSVAEGYKSTASKTEGRTVSATTTETKPERNSKITGVDNPEPATESKAPKAETKPKQQENDRVEAVQPQQPEQTTDSVNEDAESPSVDDAIVDAADSYNDTTPDEDDATVPDRNGDSVLGYYQQSFPEIVLRNKKDEPNVFIRLKSLVNRLKVASDKKEVSRLNEQISMLVRDFVQFDKDGKSIGKNAAYGDTYKWLKDNGAFDYIATKLNVNDELVFCYMSGCPRYDGVPQVVVGIVKSRDENGNINAVQPLTTLHRPNSVSSEARVKYAYLNELYDAIQSDFDSRGPDGPLYVFGGKQNPKTSKVFGIRPGIIPFSGQNNRIDQIDGYSDDAPIVMIGANNEPIVIRGNVKDSDKLFIPTRNNATNRYGQMYYMVKNGGNSYTPIALGRKSLSKDVFDSAKEGGFVDGIKRTISKIDELVAMLNDTNAAELNSKLSPILKELNTKMVLNGVFFEFKNLQLDDGSFANGLSIKWKNKDNKDENAFVESASSFNTIDVIAGLDRPIQLSPLSDRRKDTIKNLSDAINDGLIDTNAEAMRQKGVNFMFDPWNPKTAEFERLLGPDYGAENTPEIVSGAKNESSTINDTVSNDNVEVNEAVVPSDTKTSSGLNEIANVSDINDAIGKSYDDLSKEFKDSLESNGVSKDIWDSSDSEMRQAFLEC